MKQILVLFPLLLTLFSCQKDDFLIENLNNNEISVYGHGGMGIGETYPMNSFESIFNCLNLGADGTELDVQLTKDSILVAFHDMSLEHSTNTSGQICNYNWDEIRNVTYRNAPFTKHKLISLDELFSNINNIHNYTFTFDCKLYNSSIDLRTYYVSFVNAVNKISDKYNLIDNLCIESQSPVFLEFLQATDRDYKLFIYPESFEEGLNTAKRMGLYGITSSIDNISKEQIGKAHANGMFVAVWNTHSKNKNIEAINKSPDIIQTDNVEYLIKLLNK